MSMSKTSRTVGVTIGVWAGLITAALSAAGCKGGGGQGGATIAPVRTAVLAGSLVEARVGHQAVAVDDGRSVLIVGGRTLTSEASDTAELWRAGRSVPLFAAMTTARAGHRAVALPTGEVWIVGGHDARGQALRSTELYDPTTRTFRPGPELAAPRDEAAVGLGDDEVVIAFGAGETTVEAWRWDLTSRRVVSTQATGGRRGDRALVHGGGEVYVAGGRDDAGELAPPVWVDPTTGALREAAGSPHAQGVHHVLGGTPVLATLDGVTTEAYVVGGTFNDDAFTRLQRVRHDDVALEATSRLPLTPRLEATVVALDRGILIVGGTWRGRAQGAIELITAQGTSASAPLTIARHRAEGTRLTDGSVLITGGLGQDGLPVGVSELILPAGVAAPDAADLFAQARAEEATRLRLIAERDAAVAEAARLGAELATTRAELDAARQRVRDLEGALAAAQAQAASLQAQLDAARQQVAALQGQQAQLQQQLQAEQDRSAQLQQQVQAEQARAAQLQQQAQQAAQQAAQAQTSTFQIGAVTRFGSAVAGTGTSNVHTAGGR